MKDERLLVHIGVPKSATTTLQFGAFPIHPDIRYLGKLYYDESFGYEGSLATAQLCDSLWKEDELEFDPALAKQRFDQGIKPRLGKGKIAVLSEEGFSQASAADRVLIARRIKKLTEEVDCRILITIREQKRALFSGHQWNYIRRFTDLSFEEWIAWCKSYSSYYGRCNDYPLRQYKYLGLVESYMEIFGKDNVLVLPMEMLVAEPVKFYKQLETFCQISNFWLTERCPNILQENRSPGRYGTSYQRNIKLIKILISRLKKDKDFRPSEALESSKLHDFIMRSIAKFDQPPTPMSSNLSTLFDEYYKNDNSKLESITGISLSDYGYAC